VYVGSMFSHVSLGLEPHGATITWIRPVTAVNSLVNFQLGHNSKPLAARLTFVWTIVGVLLQIKGKK
jgi:hypothetical protein